MVWQLPIESIGHPERRAKDRPQLQTAFDLVADPSLDAQDDQAIIPVQIDFALNKSPVPFHLDAIPLRGVQPVAAIRGISEIVLWAHDGPSMVRFYRDILELRVISPPERVNPIFLEAGTGHAGIPQMIVVVQLGTDAEPFTKPRTLHHLAFELEPGDFGAEKARLESFGYVPRSGQHSVVPSRTMYLNDPEGNEVDLICRV